MSDRTEAPSSRKLAEAREEGRVPRSMELNSAAILLVGLLLLQGPGAGLVNALREQVVSAATNLPTGPISEAWLRGLAFNSVLRVLPSLAVILLGLLGAGIAVTEAQTRFLWASKRIGFDFSRLNPINGFKRLFSGQGLMEMFKALLKLVVVGWVAYSYLNSSASELLELSRTDFSVGVSRWLEMAFALGMRVAGVYVVLAAADYAYQLWTFNKSMRMTKEEVKEEMKRSEGDPFLKGRIRAQQRRMARSRMMANVPKAAVVITNPTHFAVAIEYHADMDAPRVVAKGAYFVAQRIVAIAQENNIPIVQNIPVARALFKAVEVDDRIPPDFYRAVAEILAYVYRLRDQKLTAPAAA